MTRQIRFVDIVGLVGTVFNVIVRLYAFGLNGAAFGREITRGGLFNGRAVIHRHDGLHGTFTKTAHAN